MRLMPVSIPLRGRRGHSLSLGVDPLMMMGEREENGVKREILQRALSLSRKRAENSARMQFLTGHVTLFVQIKVCNAGSIPFEMAAVSLLRGQERPYATQLYWPVFQSLPIKGAI